MSRTWVILLSALVGCGEGEGAPPLDCSVPWEYVLPPERTFPPSSIVWHAGNLYYSSPGRVRVVPASGGEARTLVSLEGGGPTGKLWIERDRLLIRNQHQLYWAPLEGGTPAVLGDHPFAGVVDWAIDEALDPTYLYELVYQVGGEVWRLERAPGSTREKVATLNYQLDSIALSRDKLLLWHSQFFQRVIALPRSGEGAIVIEREGDSFRGAGPEGVVFSSYERSGSPAYRIPPDGGSPVPFWPAKPASVSVDHTWPDRDGGWLVSAWQDDKHTLSRLAPDGRSGPAACGFLGIWRPDALAIGPDYVYAGVAWGSGEEWGIIRISRQALGAP